MKITYIVNQITQFGGIERVVSMLSNYFADKYNYDMRIVSLNTKGSDKSGFDFNSKIQIKHCGYNANEYGNRRLLNKRIRKILKDEEKQKTDIIIACHGNIADLIALNKKLFSGKTIFTEHASWEYYTKARKAIQILCYRRADRLVVLTESAAGIYQKYGLKNVAVIPNAVREVPKFKDTGHKAHELVAIGRLEEVKGYDNLIKAVNSIKTKLGDWKITIYGTGSKEEELKNQINAFGVEKYICIEGPTDKVFEKLHKSAGYLLSSRSEAFPMVVLESLSCGTPVVSYAFPAIKEINARNNAILEVESRDNYAAFGEAMLRLIEDKNLRATLSARSLEVAERYSLQTIADKWKELFEELLNGAKK